MSNNTENIICMRHCTERNANKAGSASRDKMVLEYFRDNGDIPESMYREIPRNREEKRFGFTVDDEGLVITENNYNSDLMVIDIDEEHQVSICTAGLGVVRLDAELSDSKRLYLDKPAAGARFAFTGEITRADFADDSYLFINKENTRKEQIDITIYKWSVVVANLHGISCNTLTFRRQPCFDRCYEILLDVKEEDALPTDYTVSADALVMGCALPVLADALKPQSMLIDGFVTNPFYCRELVFTKESDGRFTDYHVKEGTSAFRDTVNVLEIAAVG